MYHPLKYKVSQCDKVIKNGIGMLCERGDICAHYHNTDRRVYQKDEEETKVEPFLPFVEDER